MYNQSSLFDSEMPDVKISGLTYLPNYLSKQEENALIEQIDAQNWLADLKRRVQHYGYKYDYRSRRIDTSMKIGQLPDWLESIAKRLYTEGVFKNVPDQVIINEYAIGQGITHHIDCEPCFEDTIVSISLGSTCIMDLKNAQTGEKIPLLLQPRSAVILKEESRYDWEHGIAARKSDKYEGIIYPRKRRISLTFRKVIL